MAGFCCGLRRKAFIFIRYFHILKTLVHMKYIALGLLVVLASCSTKQETAPVSQYPVTEKGNVVDTVFGTRWLILIAGWKMTLQKTAAWVASQMK